MTKMNNGPYVKTSLKSNLLETDFVYDVYNSNWLRYTMLK